MLENNLLVTDRIEIREDGKKFSLFKSTIKSVKVHCALLISLFSSSDLTPAVEARSN